VHRNNSPKARCTVNDFAMQSQPPIPRLRMSWRFAGPAVLRLRTTLGTFGYMSPEQFRGERVDATSDIYSVGLISYEMVTGRRPFNPETVGHLAETQCEGVRVKPKDLRPALPKKLRI
jgi:serine/threonine protein kinase